ncbi:hypothetical protein PV11_09349 [Exophiala sideris]|uniref:Uncharacterized protein n=1 Tax=Exophiala sideris TaxID=1016849 RepID=A0A0D1Y9V4_9EURO|nr:hypothetical protein PV11_09349 [Exophiala sideris]
MPHYHSSSTSSSGGERVYHDSRREARDRKDPRKVPKREVVVINHHTSTHDPVRTSDMTNNRWK